MILLISTKTIDMAIKGDTIVFEFFLHSKMTNLFLKTINIELPSKVVLIFSLKNHSKMTQIS